MTHDAAPQSWPRPPHTPMVGETVTLEPLDPARHQDELFAVLGAPAHADLWRFIPFGPFDTPQALGAGVAVTAARHDWVLHVVRPHGGPALGVLGYMRLRPDHGSHELGAVLFSRALQRTRAATEAVFLTMVRTFDELNYRRYEWKCDSRNTASLRAAVRYGFTFEGVFRHDMWVRGENRDTAWFSITDTEWPCVRAGFEAWLDPSNFHSDGRQRRSLEQMRASVSGAP